MAIALWTLVAFWTVAMVGDAVVFSSRVAFRMAHESKVYDIFRQVVGAIDSCLLHHFHGPELSPNSAKRHGEAGPIEEGECRRSDLLPCWNYGYRRGRL